MIGNDWDQELSVIWNSPNFNKFYKKVLNLYDKETIYPPREDIFNALKLTPYKDVKVVRDAKKAMTLCHKSVYPEYF